MTDRQKLAIYNTMLNAKLANPYRLQHPHRIPDVTGSAHFQALNAAQLTEEGLRVLRYRLGLPNTSAPGDWGVEQGIGRADGNWERFIREEFGVNEDA